MRINCVYQEDLQNTLYGIVIHPFAIGARNLGLCASSKTKGYRKVVHLIVGIALCIPIVNHIIMLASRLFKDSFTKRPLEIITEQPLPAPVSLIIPKKPNSTNIKAFKLKNEKSVGVAKLRSGKIVVIKKVSSEFNHKIFNAYCDGNKIGSIKIETILWLNGKYMRSENDEMSEYGELIKYGDKPLYNNTEEFKQITGLVNKVFVSDLWSNGGGIGSVLMQAATEYGYRKGCRGRILLDASYSSHLFYYKLGMRAQNNSEKNNKLKAIYEKNKRTKIVENTSDLYAFFMYMPQEGIRKFGERIKKQPVLFKTQPERIALASRQRSASVAHIEPNKPKRRKSI